MLPSFDGICLKLKRADQQLNALHRDMREFLDSDPYEPTVQFRRIRGAREAPCVMDYSIRMIVKKPCRRVWSAIIGEIIHNLRSALDHAVYQLVIYRTDRPPADDARTQFPICLNPLRFNANALTMLDGVSTHTTGLIEQMQPFVTGEGEKSPLWHLNKLSNIDKHRTLHLTGGTVEAFNFSFPPVVNPGYVPQKHIREQGAFEHNTEIAWGRMFSDRPMFGYDQVKVQRQVAFDIVFDQRTPLLAEWSVIGTLRAIADRVFDCIDTLHRDSLGTAVCLPIGES